MKKFFATSRVRSLFMSLFFLFGFMVFGADKAAAQTVGQSGLNWVTESVAVTKLKDAVAFVKTSQLPSLVPGSAQYQVAEARYYYFSHIKELIETGASGTEQSVLNSAAFTYAGGTTSVTGVSALNANSTVNAKALYQEAVVLLTN